ncbi:MAG: SDR family NAD(P)-dependent oxidoreductase [Alphaproteobacteria bacterium]|nr:SDR family NAD(P)-dependent oxidoreductase [Alphaproteobacteria bacterium]
MRAAPFWPRMIARRSGSTVDLALCAGKTANAYFARHNATKFAVIGLTQALAPEMAPQGTWVDIICPGSSSRLRCGNP